MKNPVPVVLAAIALIAPSLYAQPSPARRPMTFETTARMVGTTKLPSGDDITATTETRQSLRLTQAAGEGEGTAWDGIGRGEILRLVANGTEIPQPASDDSTVFHFVVKPDGRLRDLSAVASNGVLPNQIVYGEPADMQMQVERLFLPQAWRSQAPKSQWEESRLDTVVAGIGDESTGRGASMSIVEAHYIYVNEGTVDTLRTKAVRVRWRAEKVKMETRSSLEMKPFVPSKMHARYDASKEMVVTTFTKQYPTPESVDMGYTGTGVIEGVAYYDSEDGVLLVARINVKTSGTSQVKGTSYDGSSELSATIVRR